MFFLLAADEAEPTTNIWLWVGIIAVFLVVMFVPQYFSRKKREKQVQGMFDNIKPGVVIKTIGGMICTILQVIEITPVEKRILVETGEGSNKATMLFDIQAVYQVIQPLTVPEENPLEEPLQGLTEEALPEDEDTNVKH